MPSASSSVCNHMVALVFGRTCTGDARRYVKRTPDFICLSGERKSHSACLQGGIWGFGHEGKQAAEAIRARFADATLVVVPPEVEGDETLLKALLPLTDVMAAGHHAAVSANVQAGTNRVFDVHQRLVLGLALAHTTGNRRTFHDPNAIFIAVDVD